MEFTGIVKQILPIQEGVSKNGNQWRKLEAIIEETGVQYPQSIVVTQLGDTIDQQRLVKGRKVTAYLGFKANEYNGRWFNSVNCWKVDNLDAPPPVANPQGQQQAPRTHQAQQQIFPEKPDMADDLPF